MLAIEIIGVAAAIIVLLLCGALLVRNAISFGKTVKWVTSKAEPKVIFLIEQADSAQRRTIAISEGRDLLIRKLFALKVQLAKMRVIMAAAAEARSRLSAVLGYVGL